MGNRDQGSGNRGIDDPQQTLMAKPRRTSLSATKPRKVDARVSPLGVRDRGFAARYAEGDTLGQGAMGVVAAVRDARIGREVALKRLLPEHRAERPDLQDRFLREARVQGQLEHPSVVPVYDIGVDEKDGPYFTMKRVRGRTLSEVLVGLRDGDRTLEQTYSRRRLLTAMSRVCLCVAYAHERGVVHRDLKPSNIMLGDYGEVHLLDWGIAQVAGISDESTAALDLSGDALQRTQEGFVIGTPGYMAPEQARGETATHGGRSDVYSLGAILFEMMTLQRLHEADSVEGLLKSTAKGVEARPSVRATERALPIELDAICTRATSLQPSQRYPGAREMNEAIEALLDGDRDSTRRAELAAQHVDIAREALGWARKGGAEADGQHRRAVAALLHALALEPEHPEARATLVRLLLEPADAMPAEAMEELERTDHRDRVRAMRENTAAVAGWWPVLPLALWMGVLQWDLVAASMCGAVLLIAIFAWMARTERVAPRFTIPALLATYAVIGFMGIFMGPLFVVPGVAVAASATAIVSLRAHTRARILINGLSQLAILIPAGLQLLEVLPPSYAFRDGQMCILPGATGLPPAATWTFLIVTNALTLGMGNVLVGRAVEALLRAEYNIFAQAWRLRQFLPEMKDA